MRTLRLFSLIALLALLVSGILSYRMLPVAALPQVDYPIIQVFTFYPGASPDVVTRAITAPLERSLGQIPGLKQMSSTSSGGASVVTLQFSLEVELGVAEQEVQAGLNSASNLLPGDLPAPPVYRKVNPADAPILTLAITSRTLPLPETVRFKNDNINRAAVSAFALAPTWKPTAGLAYGTKQEYRGLSIAVGLPESEVTQRIWASLSKGGARMVKAHYALWARWYEQGGEPGDYVNVGVSQFCADIGYTKHHKGGFRREMLLALRETWAELVPGLEAGLPDTDVLVVHGTADPIVPVEDAHWLASVLRSARLLERTGDLHDVLNEHDRDEVHALVADFLGAALAGSLRGSISRTAR